MAERYGGVRRSELEDSDFVFPDERSFPVMTSRDVGDAVSSWGRYRGSESFETFKKRLTALAKRKGFADALPSNWQAEGAMKIDEAFDPFAVKAGRRNSASDYAVMKAMHRDTKAYYMKMADYLKALGVMDDDEDSEDAAELMMEMDEAPAETKALSMHTIHVMVCQAVCDALEDLDLIDEEGEDSDEEGQMLAAMARPVMEAYRKCASYESDDDYPTVHVYDTYAVACLGEGEDWKIPYRIEGGEVVLDTPDAWERVEIEWSPVEGAAGLNEQGMQVKMLDDGTLVAQAVRFGTPDEHDMSAYKDFFTKDTNFWLDQWGKRPMLYHHAMDEGTRDAPVIGTWVKAWADDAGVWLQGQLDKAHKYYAAIKELARRGLLRVSTDSAPHLVQREALQGGVNYVKTWPIMAASLTVSPAEPRLLPAELKAELAALGIDIAGQEADDADLFERLHGAKEQHAEARRLAVELDILALEVSS